MSSKYHCLCCTEQLTHVQASFQSYQMSFQKAIAIMENVLKYSGIHVQSVIFLIMVS